MSPLRVPVRVPGTPETGYDIVLESGALERLGELCADVAAVHRYAVISDSRVAELYGEAVLGALRAAGQRAELFVFPAGEWNKTRTEWARLIDRMLAAGLGRDAGVVALGGGVAGDLGGFVAATYMRGIPVFQVPTTLLAMMDSSVGGKTGVDTEAGKNLVGAFHHPRLVVIDPRTLETLPLPQLAAGLAEAVKTAAILDEELFGWLERHVASILAGEGEALAGVIERVVRHKVRIVAEDPDDADRRAILNFGHTVGHALELLGGYEVLHGEAVAAGMRVEARIGERLGVTESGTADRLVEILEACGLERRLEEERRPVRMWEAVMADKKARSGTPRLVLLRRIGEVARDPHGAWTFEIPAARGREWIEAAVESAR